MVISRGVFSWGVLAGGVINAHVIKIYSQLKTEIYPTYNAINKSHTKNVRIKAATF